MGHPPRLRILDRAADVNRGFCVDTSKLQIDKSEPLKGVSDRSSNTQFYRLNQELARKIEEYRKVGKDPHDLFDPAKPDYVGKPEMIAPYRMPLRRAP